MDEIQRLIRPHLIDLKPYSSARDDYMGKEGVFLDANENAFGSVGNGNFNRYPDPHQYLVKEELYRQKGIKPGNIFLGNGSDEAIDLLFRAFCEPGEDEVMLLPPTYGMYEVSANINHIATRKVPLTSDFQLDTSAIRRAIQPNTKLVFVCSPNNPTGNCMGRNEMIELLGIAPGLVVVDEAYIDFCSEKTMLSLLDEFPRLVVLQTFSKAWGLANLRLGLAFAHTEVIDIINKIKPPYNINGLTQEMALKALVQAGEKEMMVAAILAQREYLRKELSGLAMVEKIYPSEANFLLVKIREAEKIFLQLIDQKVIVRNRSRVILCDNCLRITVGTPLENEQLLLVLAQIQSVQQNPSV